MRVNGYYQRTARMVHPSGTARAHDLAAADPSEHLFWSDPGALALELARLLAGKTLVCSVPTFDAPYLSEFRHCTGSAAASGITAPGTSAR